MFRSFTGLKLSEFDSIYKEIESKYPQYEIKRLSKKKRTRQVGAGRHFKLQVRNRFLMLLVYYRLYITYTLSGFLFDLDQSNIYRDISHIEPLVKRCIPLPKTLYNNNTSSTKKKKRLRTIEEVEKHFPGFKAFVDSSEQEIPRPKKKKKKKEFYSGKKKRHTVKTQYMVNGYGLILHKTGYKKGRRHDYDIYKKERPETPSQVENVLDLGYLGCEKDFPTVKYSLPVKKKKRNMELTEQENEYNKNHSRQRIIIEHTICRIKKFGIMATKYRNKLKRYDKISDIVSGLVNYRIMNSIVV